MSSICPVVHRLHEKKIMVDQTTRHHHPSCQDQTADQTLPRAPIGKDTGQPGTTVPQTLFCFHHFDSSIFFTVCLCTGKSETEGGSMTDALLATLATDQSIMLRIQSRVVIRAVILLRMRWSSSRHRAQIGSIVQISWSQVVLAEQPLLNRTNNIIWLQ